MSRLTSIALLARFQFQTQSEQDATDRNKASFATDTPQAAAQCQPYALRSKAEPNSLPTVVYPLMRQPLVENTKLPEWDWLVYRFIAD